MSENLNSKKILPTTWEVVSLGSFVESEKGKKPKRESLQPSDECNIPYIDIEAFEQGIFKSWTDGEGCRFCNENDFLMVWDGSRSGLVGKGLHGALGSTLMRINFRGINNLYAYYFLSSKFLEINTRAKGSGTPHVDPDLLWNYAFPIPPLNEQKRIVAKIEELFSELDKGIENLTTAREQLKIYRQAVLKQAFEGNLTADWREKNKNNLKSATQILEGLGTSPRQKGNLADLPSNWVWIDSGALFTSVTSGSRGWAKYYSDQGALFIRIGNLDFDSINLDLSDKQYVSPPVNAEGSRTKVQEGDFLFSITGYLGMFAIAPKIGEAYVNQHIALARPKSNFNKEYVGYYITSKSGGHYYLNKLTKGAVKAGLRLDDIRQFPVPICDLREQEEIVSQLKQKLSIIDKIEVDIDQQIQKIEALRKSILQKAFSGQLVVQDPNDEPASVLLDRIRSEKEGHAKPQRKRRAA